MGSIESVLGRVKDIWRGRVHRWGSSGMKQSIWDKEHATGKWNCCENTPGDPIYGYIEKYCHGGGLLDLGCGSGNTGNEIAVDTYSYYTGIDVSSVALEKAALRSRQNGRGNLNKYFQSEIAAYVPNRKYDVILFRESIYYLPRLKITSTLERYKASLSPKGVFIVTVYNRETFDWIVQLIEQHYTLIEKHAPASSPEAFLIFR